MEDQFRDAARPVAYDAAALAETLAVEAGVGRSALERAEAAAGGRLRLGPALLELGLIDEAQLARAYARLANARLLNDEDAPEPLETLSDRSAWFKRMGAAPVRLGRREALVMADPFGTDVFAAVEFDLERRFELVVAPPRRLELLLAEAFGGAEEDVAAGAATDDDVERLKSRASEGPVVRLVGDILNAAVDDGASDIHFEALELGGVFRFRVDGTLRTHRKVGPDLAAAAASRLKVMAELNIAERRLPQDGRAQAAVRGRNIDLRVSTLPTQFGESVVIRLLDRNRLSLDWPSLGLPDDLAERLEAIANRPHGLMLVTGPTGSGKTTTLYTALSQLDRDQRKICTIEDPIEYALDGINQVQVHPEVGMSFARALRALLRQDPDVIMVGEIRDAETTENAVRAALVGRMVLSTLHTNSAVAAIERLVDLNAPRFLIAAVLRGVASQRLVPRLCPACRVPDAAARRSPPIVDGAPVEGAYCMAEGCNACGGTGVQGRAMLAELLEIDDELAGAISDGASASELLALARRGGFRTMYEQGVALAARGEVALSAVLAAAR
ncbi:MAG: GspE/PulE family protein [Pseudomonadota bacterium]